MMNAFLLAGLLFSGQDQATRGTLAPPLLGYAFDAVAGVPRPLHGIPGAALLGEVLPLEAKLSTAAAAPEQNLITGITTEDSIPVAVTWTAGSPVMRPIAGATPGADRIALSPGGAAAVLASSSQHWIEVITGLPDAPAVRRIDASGLRFPPQLLAVSDDGRVVLAGAFWFGPDGQAHELPLPPVSALAFRTRSHDAVFITPGTDQNWLVNNIGGEIRYQPLPAYGAAQTPVAVEFSHDGRRFYVANAGGAISRFDLQGSAPEVVSCSCSPTGLTRLGGDSVFLLNGSAHPLFLLDGGGERPRLWFVPSEGGGR